MGVSDKVLLKLAAQISKILLASHLGVAGKLSGTLVDLAEGRFKDILEHREVARRFERLGEQVVGKLRPLFEQEVPAGQEISFEAVTLELVQTLGNQVTAELFVAERLETERIFQTLNTTRPFPENQFSAAEGELYRRALRETVRCLVEMADKLPRFDVAATGRTLQELGRLTEQSDEILNRVRATEYLVQALSEGDASDYEIEYRLAVQRDLDYLELFGAELRPESRRQKLSVGYVSLSLADRRGDSTGAVSAEALLGQLGRRQARLLIRGEAGSGKSTLFRWLAIEAANVAGFLSARESLPKARELMERWLASEAARSGKTTHGPDADSVHLRQVLTRVRQTSLASSSGQYFIDSLREVWMRHWYLQIPFLLRLRDCEDGKLPSPEEFPQFVAKQIEMPSRRWVPSMLEQGKGIILLDGVDEVPNFRRDSLRRQIKALVEKYPKNYFLVSTRPSAVEEDWLSTLNFREARINPMSEVDREAFIDRWHEAVAEELRLMGKSAEDLPDYAENLKSELKDAPPIARLATNPLLCAMICALHRDQRQKLPESQSELCESLCKLLLHQRERESDLKLSEFPRAYRNLSYRQKRHAVQELAYYMVRNDESSVPRDRAEEKIGRALDSFPDHSAEDTAVVTASLLERSGILRESRPGYLDFIHNTFKEYLAGERLAEEEDVGRLVEKALDPAWEPVVLFAAAKGKSVFVGDLLDRLISSEKKRRAHELMALRCRSVALQIEPELDRRLQDIARSLFPPRNFTEAEALAGSGEPVVGFLAYSRGWKARETAACVRTLRLIGTAKAQGVLRGYLGDKRKTVAVELAQAVNPLSTIYFRQMLLDRKSLPAEVARQTRDLAPLERTDDFKRIEELNLQGTLVRKLEPILNIENLHGIVLAFTPIEDLWLLQNVKSLRKLDLSGTRVKDLSPLGSLSQLEWLSLSGTAIEDLSPLTELRRIRHLDLSQMAVSDSSFSIRPHEMSWDLSVLHKLHNLQSLDLTGVKAGSLVPLRHLDNLRRLFLSGTDLRDLTIIGNLVNLEELHLASCWVEDLTPIKKLKALKSLNLRGTRVQDLAPLKELKNLEVLDLTATRVRDLSPIEALRISKLFQGEV